MKVQEIMSKNVASLKSDESVQRAAQMMKQYNVGSIPVCCDGKLEGIVTDRDIALRTIAAGHDSQQKVGEIMSTNPTVGNPGMDVNDAAKVMSQKQIRRLPITDNNNLIGIVALGDISVEPSQKESAGETLKNISQPCENQM
jgi:CBS domain-containing protein